MYEIDQTDNCYCHFFINNFLKEKQKFDADKKMFMIETSPLTKYIKCCTISCELICIDIYVDLVTVKHNILVCESFADLNQIKFQ